MRILSRMSTVVKSKMNGILDTAEDPNLMLDHAYDQQMDSLREVKRGVVDMVTALRRRELQAAKVKDSVVKLDGHARQAMSAGREDLARLALQRKQASLMELEDRDTQIADLEIEQDKLTQAQHRMQAKVAAFRTRKEVLDDAVQCGAGTGSHRLRAVRRLRGDGRCYPAQSSAQSRMSEDDACTRGLQ